MEEHDKEKRQSVAMWRQRRRDRNDLGKEIRRTKNVMSGTGKESTSLATS